jgi:mono/diheme cytochrome c family protein
MHAKRTWSALAIVAGLGLATACSSQETPPAAAPAPKAAAAPDPEALAAKAKAQEIFATTCSPCHGVNGAANGPKSDSLVPPPRNFQDPGWQASVTDSYIEQITVQGGEAVGKSAAMPPQADLASQPAVVKALREYIRQLPAH